MLRRTLIAAAGSAPLAARAGIATAGAAPTRECGTVVWKPMIQPPADIPALDGHTDTVPDIVGRLGPPIDLALFTEGNHFPALFGGIVEPFRDWARAQPRYAAVSLDNIIVVTLPQSMIVAMLLGRGIAVGNLVLGVGVESGFYPDIVMAGTAPLKRLYAASIVDLKARIFARDRGLSLLVAAGNPRGIKQLQDLAQPGVRLVLAGKNEPGARQQYIAALEGLIGKDAADAVLAQEVTSFAGRLGIQHRDVLQAIAQGAADAGIIFHHLARYFAETYPQLCAMVEVSGAEKFFETIAMTTAATPLRADAAAAFSEFFLSVARDVYPRYGFAKMAEAEFGAVIPLD